MTKNRKTEPPKLFLRFFRWFCHPELKTHIEGDLTELYGERLKEYGKATADRKFITDVLLLFRPGIIRPVRGYKISNFNFMLRNHFKIGWRHLIKDKEYSILNIGGLALGMMVAMLIGLWIYDELSFNKYHSHYERIGQVMQSQTFGAGEIQTRPNTPVQLANELRNCYGENFKRITMASFSQDYTLLYNKEALTKRGIFMESEAPAMLTLKMLSGTLQGLKEPNSILLSESTAKAFFGNDDPMNKIMKIDAWPDVKVTGVYEDLPHNSSFAGINFIAPWELFKKVLPDWIGWGNNWFQTIVEIADHKEMAQVSSLIKDVKLNKISKEEGAMHKPQLFLHPMPKWNLYSEFKQGVNVGGRIQYVWLFGIIGGFVLMLACINFMNLSTARSEKRAKEIGVRKAVGSYRSQLVYQFFVESILVAVLAFAVSLLGVQLTLPYFNEIADKEIRILWQSPLFWLVGLSFAMFTGILAGSYPALYLSSFRVINVLKGMLRVGRMAVIPRKILVVVQFAVSVTLIIGTIIVFQQIQFVKNRPVGYSQNLLVFVPIKNVEVHKHYETFRNELLQTGVVEEVAKSESPITQTFVTNSGLEWKGKDPDMPDEFVTVRVTHEFGKTIGWQIKEGRDFSRDHKTDAMALVINEAAASYMGFEDPVGEKVKWGNNGTYTIIGVIKNIVTQSPYSQIKQTFFFIDYDRTNFVNIRIKQGASVSHALAKIEDVFKRYDPVNPFDYIFSDADYAQKFGNEERIGKLASFFTALAIVISCLGIFGLASFVAEQRTKEMGVRKILGASIFNLWKMLSRDFVVLVFIALFIATPAGYYLMSGWLQQYAYRTEISWWVFAVSGLGALLITLFTVSFQSIKAATVNPVKSLRSE